jgi:Rrf2 family nitric oxide-sensitive transcriptional repressor
MFSSTTEYALRAVAFLGGRRGTLSSSDTIAEHTRVPHNYLLQILNDLAGAGLVVSKRGPRGGYELARAPESLTVLEVINVIDPFKRIRTCPLGIPSHGTKLCKLHRRMDDAMAMVEKALGDSTIAEMLERSARDEKCSFPLEGAASLTVRGRPRRR